MIIFFFPFLMDENDLFLESEVEFQNKKVINVMVSEHLIKLRYTF